MRLESGLFPVFHCAAQTPYHFQYFKMPLADGIQAARKISANTPFIPIVMYTLYKNDELEAAAKQAGVRSVVSKQDGLLNLLEAIDAELPHAK
jgi:DNA-binding NarL/FixJ family response regulator